MGTTGTDIRESVIMRELHDNGTVVVVKSYQISFDNVRMTTFGPMNFGRVYQLPSKRLVLPGIRIPKVNYRQNKPS